MAACKLLDKPGIPEEEREELSAIRALFAAYLERIVTRVIICDAPSHDRVPGLESALRSWGNWRNGSGS